MIAADTSRSKAYLQALLRHDLSPAHVLVLRNPGGNALPGQVRAAPTSPDKSASQSFAECWSEADFDVTEPIDVTLKRMHTVVDIIDCTDINDASVVDRVRRMPQSVLIYSGYGGVLLKYEILSAGKKFLHVHGGYLPDYKGSTTNYYSLLAEDILGASSLFLSEHVDSGPVLHRRKFPPPPDRMAIDHVYDSAARARVLIDTLESYATTGSWQFELPENSGGETYYIIHPVLKHIAVLAQPSGEQSR
jgi:methionyl-tRNA formyltransferase